MERSLIDRGDYSQELVGYQLKNSLMSSDRHLRATKKENVCEGGRKFTPPRPAASVENLNF